MQIECWIVVHISAGVIIKCHAFTMHREARKCQDGLFGKLKKQTGWESIIEYNEELDSSITIERSVGEPAVCKPVADLEAKISRLFAENIYLEGKREDAEDEVIDLTTRAHELHKAQTQAQEIGNGNKHDH